MTKYLTILILTALITLNELPVHAQDITGKWEGIMNDEFLRINIQQDGNSLCGYTYEIGRVHV